MFTVVGTVLDSAGNPARVNIVFKSTTTPSAIATGEIILNSQIYRATSSLDGSYEIDLEPGYYLVTYSASPTTLQTTLRIAVSASTGSGDLSSLVINDAFVGAVATASPVFLPITEAPTLPPADPTKPILAYTRSAKVYGWDTVNNVWIAMIS